MPNVYVHPSLARFTKNREREFRLQELSLSELLSSVIALRPDLKPVFMDEQGEVTSYVNVYVNGENYRHLPQDTPLKEHDQIELMTPLVGG